MSTFLLGEVSSSLALVEGQFFIKFRELLVLDGFDERESLIVATAVVEAVHGNELSDEPGIIVGSAEKEISGVCEYSIASSLA